MPTVINPGRNGKIRSDAYVATIKPNSKRDKDWLEKLRSAVKVENQKALLDYKSYVMTCEKRGWEIPKTKKRKRVAIKHRCRAEEWYKYSRQSIPTIKAEDADRTDVYIHTVIDYV